ncbi:hypothetical protein WDZ92_45030, partial [Nostoc sp. NIES-2111]
MSSLDLAVIVNCMIAALVDRQGSFVWSCFPRFDGEPVFSALLAGDPPEGGHRGVFAIELFGVTSVRQSYVP